MLFREVLGAVEGVLRETDWLHGSEVTVIRALDGTIRVFVEGVKADDTKRAGLEAGLRGAIGGWLGEEEPVWVRSGQRHQGLVDAIHAARRAWPLEPAPSFSLYLVERLAARHGWLGQLAHQPPWSVEEADGGAHAPIITFFSHKGGVGRSTALVATAVHIAERGSRVLVVDLDLEAPGLGTLLADPAPTEPGLLDLLVCPEALLESLIGTVATPHAGDLGIDGPPIQVVKAGEVDESYLGQLARLDLHGLRDVEAVTRRMGEVLRRLETEHHPDVILLDARTGFHDVGGVALGALSHGAVFLGLPNEQSWQGLRAVARMLAAAGYDEDGEPKVWLQVVQAMGASQGDAPERRRFAERAYDELRLHYYTDEHVPQEGDVPVVVLPFREALRGGGDRLTSEVVEVLRERPWEALAEAVVRRYARLDGYRP